MKAVGRRMSLMTIARMAIANGPNLKDKASDDHNRSGLNTRLMKSARGLKSGPKCCQTQPPPKNPPKP